MTLFVVIQSSHEEILEYIKERAPNMYEIYRDGPCHSFKMEKCIIYLIVLMSHISAIWMVGFVIAFKTVKLISANRQSLSGATYRLYRQFLLTLGIQAVIPLFFIIFPLFIVIVAIMIKSKHAKGKFEI
uniref:G-protein coupled receptors family 1 profile domain-containing protein n=1 Tax=Panagrolaimus sp. ES5 TaxID=591445 RepID=A0AC34FPN6_9BILA